MNRLALALIALLAFCASAGAQVIPPGTNPIPVGCAFNTAPPSAQSGQAVWQQCDSQGRSIVISGPSAAISAGLTPSTTAVLSANQTIKGSAGNLYSFEVSADATLSAAAWWVMIYDATTAPADGAVTPKKCYALATGTTSYSAAWVVPIAFTTGIVVGVSTTGCFTKTASVHAFISGDAQ